MKGNGAAAAPRVTGRFHDYFRPGVQVPDFEAVGELSPAPGYFEADGSIYYGRCSGQAPAEALGGAIPTISLDVESEGGRNAFPFDFSEVVTNLQEERYCRAAGPYVARATSAATSRRMYYLVRPLLAVPVRKHLQRIHLNGWRSIPFPRWPVDCAVDALMRDAMRRTLKNLGMERLPFIWFWPDGAESALIMTHDVEGRAGREFCTQLMDIDDEFALKSAFQLIPEPRDAANRLGALLRERGFEVNVHDWNHDGFLFQEHGEFLRRMQLINEYMREIGALGFRSGAMYRNQDWFGAFEFSYDMSVPNVAHLEPQPGGCCTVMPYFIGDVLELPLTTTQDYSLFHILGDYSIDLWKQQIDEILARHGLISFIAHPDYLIDKRARAVYVELLEHLTRVREQRNLWSPLPAEIDLWWRNRREMQVQRDGESWRIEGPGSDRARLAYAVLEGDELVYEVGDGCRG